MNFILEILMLLFACTGIIFGVILAMIAPEELKLGKKYFLLIKKVLFVILFFFINYLLYIGETYTLMVIFSILAIILFVIELTIWKKVYEIANYIIFLIPYFFVGDQNSKLILAVLIFIYGLPTGTLIKKN
jgi:hypothetical protein